MRIYIILLIVLVLRLRIPRYLVSPDSTYFVYYTALCSLIALFSDIYNTIRQHIVYAITQQYQYLLPSPHSELLLGVVVGSNMLNDVPRFSDELRRTGVIHVVVVSGYNMTLVTEWLQQICGNTYRIFNLVLVLTFTLMYALLTGFEPPVIRAWIMSFITILSHYYGLKVGSLRILMFSCYIMLLFSPQLYKSLSFILTFVSSFGIMNYSDIIYHNIIKIGFIPDFIKKDMAVSISAQLLVWPIIAFTFGNISLISLVSNTLLVWIIPLLTVAGFLITIPALMYDKVLYLVAVTIYPLSDIFIEGVRYLSRFKYSSIEYNLPWYLALSYYVVVFLISVKYCRKPMKEYEH